MQRTPERYRDAIVLAASDVDVVEAVRLARAEGMRIGIRSGGHSWAGNHLTCATTAFCSAPSSAAWLATTAAAPATR